MRITHSQLTKLIVRTESGTELGKIDDVLYDIENHTVVQYVVHSGMLKQHEYRIHPAQVIAVSAENMIVEDTVERSEDTANEPRSIPSGASPAMMREE